MKKYNISYWRAWLSQALCNCVPHMLSETYKEERKAIATFLLHQYSARGKGFMLQIVTGWNLVPQFRTVTGLAHVTLPKKTQFKSVLLSGKIMAAFFWVEKGFSCELLRWGTVMNSDSYSESLRSLNSCHHWVCPTRKMSEVFLFHDNAWLPKIVGTAETIMKVLSVVLAHPPILWPRTITFSSVWSLARSLWRHLIVYDGTPQNATFQPLHWKKTNFCEA